MCGVGVGVWGGCGCMGVWGGCGSVGWVWVCGCVGVGMWVWEGGSWIRARMRDMNWTFEVWGFVLHTRDNDIGNIEEAVWRPIPLANGPLRGKTTLIFLCDTGK